MSQAVLLVFFTVAALSIFTSDAIDRQHKSDTHIGVSPRSFQQLSEKSYVDSESEADDKASAMSSFQYSQIAKDLSNTLEEVVQENLLKGKVRSLAHLQAGTADSMTRESAAGLQTVGQNSKALRSALEKLGLDLGLDHAAAKANLRVAVTEQRSVHSRAEQLDTRLNDIEAAVSVPDTPTDEEKAVADKLLATNDAAADKQFHDVEAQTEQMVDWFSKLKKPSEEDQSAKAVAYDKQFHELEAQTQHMVEWLNQLKKLRSDRDKMKDRRDQALHAAESLGITPDEINQQLAAKGVAASG